MPSYVVDCLVVTCSVTCYVFLLPFLFCVAQAKKLLNHSVTLSFFFVAAAQQRYILLPLWRVYFFWMNKARSLWSGKSDSYTPGLFAISSVQKKVTLSTQVVFKLTLLALSPMSMCRQRCRSVSKMRVNLIVRINGSCHTPVGLWIALRLIQTARLNGTDALTSLSFCSSRQPRSTLSWMAAKKRNRWPFT